MGGAVRGWGEGLGGWEGVYGVVRGARGCDEWWGAHHERGAAQ